MEEIYEYLGGEVNESLDEFASAIKHGRGAFGSMCPDEYRKICKLIDTEESKEALILIVNELLLQQIHSILVAVDGGAWISEKYKIDIIDKEKNSVINEDIWSSHDMFIDYMWEQRGGDPYRNISRN